MSRYRAIETGSDDSSSDDSIPPLEDAFEFPSSSRTATARSNSNRYSNYSSDSDDELPELEEVPVLTPSTSNNNNGGRNSGGGNSNNASSSSSRNNDGRVQLQVDWNLFPPQASSNPFTAMTPSSTSNANSTTTTTPLFGSTQPGTLFGAPTPTSGGGFRFGSNASPPPPPPAAAAAAAAPSTGFSFGSNSNGTPAPVFNFQPSSSSGNRNQSDEEEDEDDYDDDYYDEDDDYYSEDDEDDYYDPRFPPEMNSFFRYMMRDMARNRGRNDDSDEDNDDEPCRCPNCIQDRFGCFDEGEEEDDDDLEEMLLDEAVSPCAVCLEPETTGRPFCHFPCCGGDGKEATSTLRFCKKCLVKCFSKESFNGRDEPKHNNSAWKQAGLLAGECPRCKHLLVLQDDGNDTTKKIKNKGLPRYKRIQPVLASTETLFWYISNHESGDSRPYLLTAALGEAGYIPEELLLDNGGSQREIAKLCQWGLLTKQKRRFREAAIARKLHLFLHKKFPKYIGHPDFDTDSSTAPNSTGSVYSVKPDKQIELQNLFSKHLEVDITEEGVKVAMHTCGTLPKVEHSRKQCMLVALNCAQSALIALRKFRLGRAIRIANRGCTLALLSSNYVLPAVTEWPSRASFHTGSWYALTTLNLTLSWFGLQMVKTGFRLLGSLLWIGAYGAGGFLTAWLVGSCLVTPQTRWKRWIRNSIILCLGAQGMYRLLWSYSSSTGEGSTGETTPSVSGEFDEF